MSISRAGKREVVSSQRVAGLEPMRSIKKFNTTKKQLVLIECGCEVDDGEADGDGDQGRAGDGDRDGSDDGDGGDDDRDSDDGSDGHGAGDGGPLVPMRRIRPP